MEKVNIGNAERKPYRSPQINRWGTVADLTRVGSTTAGYDVWPAAAGKNQDEPGSIIPNGKSFTTIGD